MRPDERSSSVTFLNLKNRRCPSTVSISSRVRAVTSSVLLTSWLVPMEHSTSPTGLILESADITITTNPSLEPSTESRRKGLNRKFLRPIPKPLRAQSLSFQAPPKMFASSGSRLLRPMDPRQSPPSASYSIIPMNMFRHARSGSSLSLATKASRLLAQYLPTVRTSRSDSSPSGLSATLDRM